MSCKCSCLWCVSTPPLWCQLLMSKVVSRLYSKWCPHTHNWSGSKPSNCWDSFYHALHTSKFISLSLFDHIYSQIIVIWHTLILAKGQLISKEKFKVFIWTKNRTKIFLYFCPSSLKWVKSKKKMQIIILDDKFSW